MGDQPAAYLQHVHRRRGRALDRRPRPPARPGAAAVGAAPARPDRPAHPRPARRPRSARWSPRSCWPRCAGVCGEAGGPPVRAGADPGPVRGLGRGHRSTWWSRCWARRWWRWGYGRARRPHRLAGRRVGAGLRRHPRAGRAVLVRRAVARACRWSACTSPAAARSSTWPPALGALLPVLLAQLAGFSWMDGLLRGPRPTTPHGSSRTARRCGGARSAWSCCCWRPGRRWCAAPAGSATRPAGRSWSAPGWRSPFSILAGLARGGAEAAWLPFFPWLTVAAVAPDTAGRRAAAAARCCWSAVGAADRHRRRGRAGHPVVTPDRCRKGPCDAETVSRTPGRQASSTSSSRSSLQASSTPSGSRIARSGLSACTAPGSWVTSTIAPG